VAETTGLVQRLSVFDILTCVWIGPTPDNAEILLVLNDGSAASAQFAGTLVEVLSAAMTNYRSVAAIHADDDATITSLRIDPV
jgi:hypothetical protein